MAAEKPLDIECDCEYCKQQARLNTAKEVFKFIGGAIMTTIAVEAAIVAAPAVLGAAGFASTGVRAGSVAAKMHSWWGNVRKASTFAHLMSMGAKGALNPAVRAAMRSIAQVLYAGGATVAHLLNKDEKGNLIIPVDPYELQNLQSELIKLGLLCRSCLKPTNREKAGLCTSVCACHR